MMVHIRFSAGRALVGLATLVVAVGCVRPRDLAKFDGARPTMRPETFFAGTTTGWGVIQTRDGRPSRPFEVSSEGTTQRDGHFRLSQTVRFADGKVDRRVWVMTRIDATHYRASLSDARGPVRAEVHGNVFHLEYPLRRRGVVMEQWLYLLPDGKTVLNTGTIRALGIPVARLSERISRED